MKNEKSAQNALHHAQWQLDGIEKGEYDDSTVKDYRDFTHNVVNIVEDCLVELGECSSLTLTNDNEIEEKHWWQFWK